MHRTKLHPLTGEPLLPVYWTRDGIPRFPIIGAADDPDDDGTDDGDEDDGDDDGDGEKPIYTKTDLSNRLTREKKQGEAALARRLGYSSVKELEAAQKEQKEREDAQLSEVEKREKEAAERERKAAAEAEHVARERREGRLERALVRKGVSDDDLEDAIVLLDRALDDDEDELEAILDAADELKERRPELFGVKPDDDEDDASKRTKRKGTIPDGKPGKRKEPAGKAPGSYGRERAARRFGKKDDKD